MQISPELIAKYNQPIPRYTSYPPANFFKQDFSEAEYKLLLSTSSTNASENISIYIHIPFCKKLCFYCGCNAMASNNLAVYQTYVDALCKEIEMVKKMIGTARKVSQIHYGGGTPNAIPAALLQKINTLLFNSFSFIEEPEIAIECNPAYLDETYMTALLEARFNRFSLGIQDFRKDVLDTVNRDTPAMGVKKIMDFLRQQKGVTINLDFIYGLPLQTPESFAETIKHAVTLSPDRIVTFSYAHVPWVKPLQKKLEIKGLPSPEEKSKMFQHAYDIITEAGYVSVGMDHYAKPDDVLSKALKTKTLHRNFQGYCTRETTGDVFAFGVSSISQLASGFVQNTKEISAYTNAISENKFPITIGYQLNEDETIIKNVIEEVMCNGYIHWKTLANRLNISADKLKLTVEYTPEKMTDFVTDGLLLNEGEITIEVTDLGRYFIRNIAAKLDPLLANSDKQFSKSV